jgi:hypothetical protein
MNLTHCTYFQFSVKTKFDIKTPFQIVLADGCEIDDEDGYNSLTPHQDVYFLEEGESLQLPLPSASACNGNVHTKLLVQTHLLTFYK